MKVVFSQLFALALFCPWLCLADDTNDLASTNKLAAARAARRALEAGLHYETGTITLRDGLATVNLTNGFRFLGPDDARIVLQQIWRNPPGLRPLGMMVPPDAALSGSHGWAVVISYREDGHVKDADADKIDYDAMLKDLQKATREASKERVKQGYPSMEFVGWAEPPRYDSATHKMYWAREIRFGDASANTLNYNIRILGRRGVLVLNAVASMRELPEIREQSPAIVKMVDFDSGNRYADFDSHTDKVAAYGLAALVAGGVLAKLGGFKLLVAGLLAAKKFIIIGVAGVAAYLKKIFNRKPPSTPDSTPAGPAA